MTKLKGILLCFGLDNKEELKYLIKNAKKVSDEYHIKVLVGTKADKNSQRQIEKSEAIEASCFEFGKNCKYIEVSSISGVGIQELFKDL